MKGKTNPIAKMMQTPNGRRLFGEKTIPARKGKGSYKRKRKYRSIDKYHEKGSASCLF